MPDGVQSITTDALEIASSEFKSDSIPNSLNPLILSSLTAIRAPLFKRLITFERSSFSGVFLWKVICSMPNCSLYSQKRQIKAERNNREKWLSKWGKLPAFNEIGMIKGLQ